MLNYWKFFAEHSNKEFEPRFFANGWFAVKINGSYILYSPSFSLHSVAVNDFTYAGFDDIQPFFSGKLALFTPNTVIIIDGEGKFLAHFPRTDLVRCLENNSVIMKRGGKIGIYRLNDLSKPFYLLSKEQRLYCKNIHESPDGLLSLPMFAKRSPLAKTPIVPLGIRIFDKEMNDVTPVKKADEVTFYRSGSYQIHCGKNYRLYNNRHEKMYGNREPINVEEYYYIDRFCNFIKGTRFNEKTYCVHLGDKNFGFVYSDPQNENSPKLFAGCAANGEIIINGHLVLCEGIILDLNKTVEEHYGVIRELCREPVSLEMFEYLKKVIRLLGTRQHYPFDWVFNENSYREDIENILLFEPAPLVRLTEYVSNAVKFSSIDKTDYNSLILASL